jgi:hypothetical protein
LDEEAWIAMEQSSILEAVLDFLGNVVTILGFPFAIWTLRLNRDWKRREYVMKLIEEWNARTIIHRQVVEKAIPTIWSGHHPNQAVVEFSEDFAKRVFFSKPSDQADWELKFHLNELLNYFELICSSWKYGIANKRIVKEMFQPVLVRWHWRILSRYICEIQREDHRDPWPIYSAVMNEWYSEPSN